MTFKVLAFVLGIASMPVPIVLAQNFEQLPNDVSSNAEGMEAEAVLFSANGMPHPGNPVTFSFDWAAAEGASSLNVTFHRNLAGYGPGQLLGSFVPTRIFATPRMALLGMAVSSAASDLAGRRTTIMSGFFPVDAGNVFAVIETQENFPFPQSSYLRLNIINVIATTETLLEADLAADAAASNAEMQATAGWLIRGFPPESIELEPLLPDNAGAILPPPPPEHRVILSGAATTRRIGEQGTRREHGVILGGAAAQSTPIPYSCGSGYDWASPFNPGNILPSPLGVGNSTSSVGIDISCRSCGPTPPGRLCVICNPNWDVEAIQKGSVKFGTYHIRLLPLERYLEEPPANNHCKIAHWRIEVIWGIEVIEFFPLQYPVYDSTIAGEPSNYIWTQSYSCLGYVACLEQ